MQRRNWDWLSVQQILLPSQCWHIQQGMVYQITQTLKVNVLYAYRYFVLCVTLPPSNGTCTASFMITSVWHRCRRHRPPFAPQNVFFLTPQTNLPAKPSLIFFVMKYLRYSAGRAWSCRIDSQNTCAVENCAAVLIVNWMIYGVYADLVCVSCVCIPPFILGFFADRWISHLIWSSSCFRMVLNTK